MKKLLSLGALATKQDSKGLTPLRLARQHGHGKVGLIHVDAHADVNEHMFGEQLAHGTPFRRAVEEDLLDCRRVVQIGLRGTGYAYYLFVSRLVTRCGIVIHSI